MGGAAAVTAWDFRVPRATRHGPAQARAAGGGWRSRGSRLASCKGAAPQGPAWRLAGPPHPRCTNAYWYRSHTSPSLCSPGWLTRPALLHALPCRLPALQPDQIRQCLLDYASIGVWQVDDMNADTPTLIVNDER